MVRLVITGWICEITEEERKELEYLMRKFGNVRRRAYAQKWKGKGKAEIVKILREDTGLNVHYIESAYYSIEDLPPRVVFGGKKNLKLRAEGKISKEEYRKRRNSVLISRWERFVGGNVNIRLDLSTMKLEIDCCNGKHIYPRICIPRRCLEKYGEYLDGSYPYAVIIKRLDDDRGFKVRFIVNVEPSMREGGRIDVNVEHTEFVVMNKEGKSIGVVADATSRDKSSMFNDAVKSGKASGG